MASAEASMEADNNGDPQPSTSSKASDNTKPTCVIILGMAGSGKTTFVQRITAHLHTQKTPPYVINLDPATHEVPFPANIDIRDTVNYKEVMKQYSLGPNGGIVTSLNLFATRFDQVMKFIEKRGHESKYVLIDTPGQIEVFTWSASGSIITETLASSFPTVVVYVMDTARSVNPVTFMSNMLYACSILYKTKLPFVVVMNKTDIVDHSFAVEWMTDFKAFQDALEQETTYVSSLTRSMSLVLDKFYSNLKNVGVSSVTGAGVEEFFKVIGSAREEYEKEYKPAYEKLKQEQQDKELARQQEQLSRLKMDMASGDGKAQSLADMVTSRHVEAKSAEMFISPGAGADDDDETEQEMKQDEDEEEVKEYESFKRFLEKEKERRTAGKNEPSTSGT